jgi:AcrR family transcriptional regulator
MLNVRTVEEDRTAAAVIRDSAMALFAERGAADVTIREVATAAGVSPGLVVHHYGSKNGLREAVDARVVRFVRDVLADVAADGSEGGASLSTPFVDAIDREPEIIAYVGRLLIDGGSAADDMFSALFEATLAGMAALVAAGVARPAGDERVRAAFLLANDLAVLLLRPRITAVLGSDPLAQPGVAAWAAELADTYTSGIFVAADPSGSDAHLSGRPS